MSCVLGENPFSSQDLIFYDGSALIKQRVVSEAQRESAQPGVLDCKVAHIRGVTKAIKPRV